MNITFFRTRYSRVIPALALVLFALSMSMVSCSNNEEQKEDKTIIEGSIQNPTHSKISFCTYPDTVSLYLGAKQAVYTVDLDAQGHFKFAIDNKTPVVFDLESGEQTLATNLIVLPGSHLEIKFTGKENRPNIVSSGEASEFNGFLIELLDSFYESPSLKQEYYIGTNYMDIHYFSDYLDKRRQAETGLYNSYFEGKTINKVYEEYAKNTIDYCWGADKLYYLWKKRMKIENIHGDSAYFSFQTKSFIQNAGAINCPSYIRYLNLYIKDYYERLVETGALPKVKGEKLIPDVEKFMLAHELLDSTFRDIALYNIYFGDTHDLAKGAVQDTLRGRSLDSLKASFCRKYNLTMIN